MRLTFEELREKAAEHAKAAREVSEKAAAAGRELTAPERDLYDASMKAAGEYLTQMKQRKADNEVAAAAKALAAEIGAGPADDDGRGGHRLKGSASWGTKTAAAILNNSGKANGEKALVSGTISTSNPVAENVQTFGRAPATVLDLLMGSPANAQTQDGLRAENPRYEHDGLATAKILGGDPLTGNSGNTFTFLRQTVRDNKAAPVADGATKPTSIYTLKEEEDRFRVVAHLSEPLPVRYFHDEGALSEFLNSEMGYGLARAVETQALTGDGTNIGGVDNMTGLLETAGIHTQAWNTDLLTTLRKSLTTLQSIGRMPNALVLHPADAERVDLLREAGTSGKYLIGDPGADASSTLWQIPRVTSVAVTPGTAILGNWTGARLLVRQEATLNVNMGGELFHKNQCEFRVECRVGLAVFTPDAFVEIDIKEPVTP